MSLCASAVVAVAVTGVFDQRGGATAYAAGAGTPGGEFFPIEPLRIVDTRAGLGAPVAPLRGGAPLSIGVTGFPARSVPSAGVMAVVLNVTVDQPSAGGFLTVYPTGAPRPLASNLNFVAGQTVPNLVVVGVGAGGTVELFVNTGLAHVVVDIAGWYASAGAAVAPGVGSRLTAVSPQRLLDTRSGIGHSGMVGQGQTIELQIAGRVVDRSGNAAPSMSGVVLNLTGTEPTIPTYVTAFPSGPLPVASSLNLAGGETRANLVMVKLGDDGRIRLYNHGGRVHLVADVVGFYTAGADPNSFAGRVVPLTAPYRAFDTRTSGSPLPQQNEDRWSFADLVGSVDRGPVGGLIMNITATETSASSFLTAYPADARRPVASNLNPATGRNIPNLAVVALGQGATANQVNVYNGLGVTHYLADVAAVVLAD